MRFRFLFCPWPTLGACYPLLAAAGELRKRGHEVCFFGSATIQPTLSKYGFAWFQAPPEPSPLHPESGRKSGARHYLLAPIRSQMAALSEALRSFNPDVLVDGMLPFGPRLLAEAQGRLHASICTPACLLPSEDLFPYGLAMPPPKAPFEHALAKAYRERQKEDLAAETQEWNALRLEIGLTGGSEHPWLSVPSRHLVILPTTPEFEYPRHDLPEHAHFVGPLNWRGGAQPEVPREVLRLGRDRDLLYVSQGTFFIRDYPVIRLAFEALAGEPVAMAVSTGRRMSPGELGGAPANAVLRPSFCLWKLFRIAKAAMVHGGMGGVNEALTAGIPLVVMPLEADQPEVAQRCVQAGAGLSLDVFRSTAAELREAVREVLGNPSYRRRAREIAASYGRHDGPAEAAELLVELARTGRPVLRPVRREQIA